MKPLCLVSVIAIALSFFIATHTAVAKHAPLNNKYSKYLITKPNDGFTRVFNKQPQGPKFVQVLK